MLIIWCGGPDICHLYGILWIIASCFCNSRISSTKIDTPDLENHCRWASRKWKGRWWRWWWWGRRWWWWWWRGSYIPIARANISIRSIPLRVLHCYLGEGWELGLRFFSHWSWFICPFSSGGFAAECVSFGPLLRMFVCHKESVAWTYIQHSATICHCLLFYLHFFLIGWEESHFVIFLFDLYQIRYIQSSMSDCYGGMQTDRHWCLHFRAGGFCRCDGLDRYRVLFLTLVDSKIVTLEAYI